MGRAMDYSSAPKGASVVERVLKTDPLLAAEQITGKSYKEDEGTEQLGMALMIEHNHDKRALLSEADDTYYSMPWRQFLRIAEEEGFETDSYEAYQYAKYTTKPVTLHKFVAVHPSGLLLLADSYQGVNDEVINSANVYHNTQPDKGHDRPYSATGSGCLCHVDGESVLIDNPNYDPAREYEEDNPKRIDNPAWDDKTKQVYVGDIHVVEGMRYKLARLNEVGTSMSPWAVRPWLPPNLNLMDREAWGVLEWGFGESEQEGRWQAILKTFEGAPAALELIKDAIPENNVHPR